MSRPTLDMPIDYVDFLRACVEAEVEFVVVGGWAVSVHGYGRSTDDLDVFVRADAANAARLVNALEDFGAPLKQHGVDASLFAQEGMAYRMGRKPVQIEILTTIDGVDFEAARAESLHVSIDDVEVLIIGRDALLANKRASGRAKDLADVEALEAE